MESRQRQQLATGAAIAFLSVAVACGSDPPTAPRIATPPPAATPNQVDWDALARLFDDPLFRGLAAELTSQEEARPLARAADELVAGIRTRDIDVSAALDRLAQERLLYSQLPGFHHDDSALLSAFALFEMRGRSFLHAGSTAAGATLGIAEFIDE